MHAELEIEKQVYTEFNSLKEKVAAVDKFKRVETYVSVNQSVTAGVLIIAINALVTCLWLLGYPCFSKFIPIGQGRLAIGVVQALCNLIWFLVRPFGPLQRKG
jgi:hypothetical protein